MVLAGDGLWLSTRAQAHAKRTGEDLKRGDRERRGKERRVRIPVTEDARQCRHGRETEPGDEQLLLSIAQFRIMCPVEGERDGNERGEDGTGDEVTGVLPVRARTIAPMASTSAGPRIRLNGSVTATIGARL